MGLHTYAYNILPSSVQLEKIPFRGKKPGLLEKWQDSKAETVEINKK